jgi:hypothetical protein
LGLNLKDQGRAIPSAIFTRQQTSAMGIEQTFQSGKLKWQKSFMKIRAKSHVSGG